MAERPMVAIKGRQEFCPFSPVCHKILWTSEEITSFEVSITIPELSNIQIFSSNMKAERNSSTGRNRNKNKNKGRFDGNKDRILSKSTRGKILKFNFSRKSAPFFRNCFIKYFNLVAKKK